MQKKLIIIFLLFGAIQNSVCAKLITSEKPFLVVTRSFPCSETVHKARFFYEQVKSLGQVQGKVFSFTAPSNKKVLEHFKSMQPRAKVFEPGAGKIRQLGVFLTSQVKALSASTGKRRSVSIKFEFESGKHEMSAVFWFVKRGSLVECDVYLQGYTHSVSSLVTNLIRAIICDDSMLSKHWGKGVLTVAAAGLVVGLSQRRTKDESKPEAAPISIDSFKNQLHQSLVTLLTGFNSPSSLYFNDNNGKAVSVAIGTEFKPVQEKTLFNSVQIAFAVDAQAAEAFTCASSRRKCSDAGYDFKFIDQNFVVLQGDLDSVVLISHQGKQVFNDMGLLLQELSKKIESDVRAITVAKNAETMVEQSIFAGKFPRAFSEIPEDVKLGVELLPPMRTLVRRMVDSNEKETAQLRRLIVEQDCFGDVFSRAAHLVSKMPSLSVEAVAKHETFIVGLLKRLYEKYPNRSGETRSVISPLRQDSLLNEYESAENKMIDQILKELPVGSELLARGTSALVYKVPILSAHVVLKVANPYFYIKARCFTGPALAVNQNLSLRRHVRRALIADIINKRFSAYGLRAPIKKLCLRQGASPEGPVDDRFMVVVSQFIEQPDSFLSGEATDEQVMNALRIMQLMKSTDVCASNVILLPSTDPSRALDFMFIDTETPYQVGKRLDHLSDVLRIHSYSYFFRSQPFHDKLRNEKTELQRKQVLERRVAPRELDNYLHERVKALVKDIESDCVEPMHLPARDYERIYLQRTRLSEYLNILMKKEWLTEAQVEVIKNFWMGPDIHHGFLLLNIILIFNSRRAYLNGMTSNIGWNVKDLSDDEIEAFKVYESEFLEKHPSMDSKKTENGALEGRRRRE